MPFQIVRNDITRVSADAIVNTANPNPVIGSGTDAQIHKMAGPELLIARQCIGRIDPGHAAVTPAYKLDANYVIHTVGPAWIDGAHHEPAILRSCYESSLLLALENGCNSIAFPLISAGNYGFPGDLALQIAISVFTAFLSVHEMQIYLVVFDSAAFRLSQTLFRHIDSYIDENYVESCQAEEYGIAEKSQPTPFPPRKETQRRCRSAAMGSIAPMAAPKATSLEELLLQTDAGFTETLLKLIDKAGKTDPQIYKKANISKQHFSKIRNNPDYRPTKPTALALALALELNLEETRDLIGRAGFALTNSSKFDLIIRYFIENRNYNVVEINCVLFQHDQALLG